MGSDNYLKFASASIATGLQLANAFTAQRIHDKNAGTMRVDKLLQKARQHLLIARELKLNVPVTARLSRKVFSRAAADYIRCWARDAVCDKIIASYLWRCRPMELLDIAPRTVYNVFRRWGSTG
jgi:hypothetical protein